MQDRILDLCKQLLRSENLTVAEMVAEQLHAAIETYVNQLGCALPNAPLVSPRVTD